MKTLLLVDDSPAFREIAQLMLGYLGYRVIVSCDGTDAVAMAVKTAPNLILMDINMPHLNGPQTVAAIRKQPTIQTIPIVAVTADPFWEIDLKFREFGFDGFLSKPFTLQQLQQSLDGLLQSR